MQAEGSVAEVEGVVRVVAGEAYGRWEAELRCGSLSAACHLYPPPLRATQEQDFTSSLGPQSRLHSLLDPEPGLG